jgi:hypothetical protein
MYHQLSSDYVSQTMATTCAKKHCVADAERECLAENNITSICIHRLAAYHVNQHHG